MLYNIVTGHNGLTLRTRSEIVVLVTSLDQLETTDLPLKGPDGRAVRFPATHAQLAEALAVLRG